MYRPSGFPLMRLKGCLCNLNKTFDIGLTDSKEIEICSQHYFRLGNEQVAVQK